MEKRLEDKIYHYLLDLFETSATSEIHEFLMHSVIYVEYSYTFVSGDGEVLHIIVDPQLYKKYQQSIHLFKISILNKYFEFTHRRTIGVEVYPDLNKFQILQNTIVPIITPWEEINNEQNHMIKLLKSATNSIDYQNVGNAGRTILQKLSNIVFIPSKHIPEALIDLSEGKFKNRLHTYIKCELSGSINKELRDFSIAAITTAEKSVDLANRLTHDLNANPLLAEVCTISIVTVESIIKLINSTSVANVTFDSKP
ncbi:MAG: hypothetical protein IPO85_00900 [Saprospiraceae bacterium]|uniref:Uncharacterized protein n=1 Tax=Candidatus Defluviibacterium haderslevense TaxID=2981993 RepID=A0A9D7S582_9BACT|nr:hypothetical protein [Candidatus Defluviibacterium haderslevense]